MRMSTMQPQKDFFIGSQTQQRACHSLDISAFVTFEQLKGALAKRFGFADSRAICLIEKDHSPITSLEAIHDASEPIELRTSHDDSVREPPGPRALPLVGNLYEVYPDALGNYDRLFARFGPVIKTVNMGTTIYHTNDPEIARHVLREDELFTKTTSDPSHPLHYMSEQDMLFTCDSDSPAFKPSHKFIPPALSPRAIAHYTPKIQQAARTIFNVFDELAESDKAFNVYQFMFKLASQIIWRVVADQDLHHFDKLQTPPALPLRLFGQYLSLMKKSSLRPQWFKHLPFGEPARLRVVRQQMFDNCEEALNASIDKDGPKLSLSDPTATQQASCVADYLYRVRDAKGEGLSYDLLLGNVVVTLGAGFTTSSSLLSWAIYALVRYPGNQERLLEEIVQHGGDGSKSWTYQEIHAMPFLDCFIKEVLRLHSPSFQTARNAKRDVILPGGYLIPKGSIIIPCFPSLHKNPKHWDNPLRFDPERWMEDGLAARMTKQGSYTPFAAGGRGCVGFNLALLQVKMVVVELVYRYLLEDSSAEPVVYDPEFLVVRPLNFYASITKREEWPAANPV